MRNNDSGLFHHLVRAYGNARGKENKRAFAASTLSTNSIFWTMQSTVLMIARFSPKGGGDRSTMALVRLSATPTSLWGMSFGVVVIGGGILSVALVGALLFMR
jgi:hypothetical protein